MGQETPMLRQYRRIKAEHEEAILLFRLGDFYEMFMEDAEIAAGILEIVLTSREAGKEGRIPMCGIPVHAASGYIARLIERGYKVAVCEQVEDPKKAKGLVKREVVKIITPGTLTDLEMLDEKSNNYLMGIAVAGDYYGLAVSDLSTGDFLVTQFPRTGMHLLVDELHHWQPREILVAEELQEEVAKVARQSSALITPRPAREFQPAAARDRLCEHFQVVSLEGFGCQYLDAAVAAAGAVLAYFQETQKARLEHLNTIRTYFLDDFMRLDLFTRRNLELVRTIRENKTHGSLLWVLDRTVTAMGARLLRKWIEQPLRHQDEIEERLEKVAAFYHRHDLREEIRGLLKSVCDLQRLLARLSCGTVNPRELLALGRTLALLPEVKELLVQDDTPALAEQVREVDLLPELCSLLTSAIREDAPASPKEGNIFCRGYHPELDKLLQASHEGKAWIAGLERKERERTGIKSLKVGFNQVFGYYIEVTKANLAAVPEDYQRRQTLANAERFITPELKKYEELVLGAEERRTALEYELFLDLRRRVLDDLPQLRQNASILAELDVLAALAETAVKSDYCRPVITRDRRIKITAGRHPVVEKVLPPGEFVPNDTLLDGEKHRLQIITGPNMAGKSTYMRQVALIVLMAQIGSFVPANEAEIGLVDRIFTRVGAADDLAGGQSTFMVEMNELANILHHATADSLLILDEIGRGTSTYDGLSIAWAALEYLWDPEKIGARTLFATHYHELIELEKYLPGVENLNVAVVKKDEKIIFLRKIMPGGSDESYGIEVARLAGLPKALLDRARAILADLETKEEKNAPRRIAEKKPVLLQLPLFHPAEEELTKELLALKLDEITPRRALELLYNWQERLTRQKKEA
ncbi:MAG: DNA mismatch repair protein MutS [Firmicutes bacterium]|nr:DNA mismatch repair protein MutS [Bacillota bacterium]